jgi:hypothetical protein
MVSRRILGGSEPKYLFSEPKEWFHLSNTGSLSHTQIQLDIAFSLCLTVRELWRSINNAAEHQSVYAARATLCMGSR